MSLHAPSKCKSLIVGMCQNKSWRISTQAAKMELQTSSRGVIVAQLRSGLFHSELSGRVKK